MATFPQTRQGRRPVSQRATKPVLNYDQIFGNSLSLDADIQAEIDRKGLVARFVDAKKLQEFGGYHPKGWVPYKREKKSSDTIGTEEFKFGNDPSGIIRRGSLILAVKTKEDVAKHRMFLDQRAELQTTQHSQGEKAQELRQFAKEKGLDANILEGVEENE